MFTGSVNTGKSVMKNASDSLKRLTLELDGNDAGIVLPVLWCYDPWMRLVRGSSDDGWDYDRS